MTSPRVELAAAIAEAGGDDLSVFSEEPPGPPALPAIVLTPGTPYRRVERTGPRCIETYRLRALALVPIDAAGPLDSLDALADLVRDVLAAMPADAHARYLGVAEAATQRSVGGKSQRAAVVDLEVTG